MAPPTPPGDAAGPGASHTLETLSATSEKLDKILSFLAKVVTGVVVVTTLIYRWLGEQVLVVPRQLVAAAIAALVVVGAGVWILAYRRRARWGRWRALATVIGGGVCLGLAVVLSVLRPPEPAWQRIDVFKLLTQSQAEAEHDLPLIMMRDQLSGANGLIPGGETYKHLLTMRREGEAVQEQWAGYYAPLMVPSTMPTELSLRQNGILNGNTASLGVVVVVWTPSGDGITVSSPKEFGFASLQDSVTVPLELRASQRAAMLVFVYPWTAAASANLPERIADAVNVR